MSPQHKILWIGFSQYYFEVQKNLPKQYSLTFEQDCLSAIIKIKKEQPNLILAFTENKPLIEFCESRRNKFNSIPFIYLTTDCSLYNKLKILESGVDAYIDYSVTIVELMTRIETLMRKNISFQVKFRTPAFIALVNSEIDKNISDPSFSSKQLAIRLSMSRSQFFKKIKKYTSNCPSSYIRSYRLQKAKSLIENSFDSISQISLQVGFNNLTYFSTQFKKLFGLPPSSLLK